MLVEWVKGKGTCYSALNCFKVFPLCFFQLSDLLKSGTDADISVWNQVLYLFQNPENLVDLFKNICPKYRAEVSDRQVHSAYFRFKFTELHQCKFWPLNLPFCF